MSSNINLLMHIEKISAEASRCKLNFAGISEISDEIIQVASFLDITYEQTVLFSCMVELSLQRIVTVENLARHLKCNVLRIINLIYEIDVIEHKSLINKSCKSSKKRYSYNDLGYSVPQNVIEALRTNDKSKLTETTQLSLPNLLERMVEIIDERESNSSSTQVLLEQIEFLIQSNKDKPFIAFVNKVVKKTINRCVLLSLAFLKLKRQVHYDFESIVSTIFDDLSMQLEYQNNFLVGNNELIKNGIIIFKETQFADERIPVLTQKAIKILYKNYPELAFEDESGEGIIKSINIKPKKLFFDEKLSKQIDIITRALSQKNFKPLQSRLLDSNLPIGISAIFYGSSGTGKTEAVFQIAKRTKRDIMMVDLSQVRSKWFGESEKQVKRIFDEYRRIFFNNHVKPILFINEADGMLAKRMKLSGDSSTEQAMNTIQNIILQELESFEGILFATTNLTMNLDSAFERRFLFKVEFKNPNSAASEQIWKSKIPELKPAQLRFLSTKFQFSGGEIENVSRKYLMGKIINHEPLNFDKLVEYCEQEKPFQKHTKIGYKLN